MKKQEEKKKGEIGGMKSIRVKRKEVLDFKGRSFLKKEIEREMIRTKRWLDLKFKI